MAVPSSGPLELRGDINLEINGNVTDTNVALHQLSLDAGFSTPDAMSDFYGYSSVVPPSVTTNSATNVGCTSITLNGNITDTGGENVSRGFYFGTNCTTSTSNTKYTLAGTQGTGTYLCTRTGLPNGTAYYYWAWGCNSAGETIAAKVNTGTGYPPYTPPAVFGGNAGTSIDYLAWTNIGDGCMNLKVHAGYRNPYNNGRVYTANCSRYGTLSQLTECCSPDIFCDIQTYCSFGTSQMWAHGIQNFGCSCTYTSMRTDNALCPGGGNIRICTQDFFSFNGEACTSQPYSNTFSYCRNVTGCAQCTTIGVCYEDNCFNSTNSGLEQCVYLAHSCARCSPGYQLGHTRGFDVLMCT